MTKFIRNRSLLVVLTLLILYALNDAWNSGNTGVSDANRGSVYVLLITIMVVMSAHSFMHPIPSMRPQYVALMYILTGWILMENLIVNVGGWLQYVHLFLALWWIVSYYYFYSILRNKPRQSIDVRNFFFVMMCLYMGLTVYAYTSMVAIRGDSFKGVLNYAYSVLAFVPFVFLFPKKICNLSLVAILGLLVFSMKRGPLIIFPLMYLTYQYASLSIKHKYSTFISRLILFVVFFGIAFYIGDQISDGFLSHRFGKEELQDGSNRRYIYELAFNDIQSRDFITLLLGTGSGSSINLIGTGVHNEWLEFLFTFGLIGVILYFIFGLSILKRYRQYLRRKSPFAPILGTLTVFFWTVGMFSGFYFTHSSFYFFSCLGVIEALEHNRKKEKRKRLKMYGPGVY